MIFMADLSSPLSSMLAPARGAVKTVPGRLDRRAKAPLVRFSGPAPTKSMMNRHGLVYGTKAAFAVCVTVVILSLLAGCRTEVRTAPPPAPAAPAATVSAARPGLPATPGPALARLGYTVQVGAFAVESNARAFAATLTAAGLDAFYFPAGGGLFKVRFGDFASREAARERGAALRAGGRIGEFFIVGPADYALARTGGPAPPAAAPSPAAAELRGRLAATAESFLGIEYVWGGTSSESGFDCSGLTSAVYRLNGLDMPRSVGEQHAAGTAVGTDRLTAGDLVFFAASPGGPLTHVGIYVGGGVFIHAPGRGKTVRRESLGAAYFRARFAGARSYL
jgi:cell wall-associated NlpC family hydrolase